MITTKFVTSGTDVRVVKIDDSTALDKLPPKIYAVQLHPMMGFYLTTIKDELTVPQKIYGSAARRAEKCLKTYEQRTSSTGVLLTGHKGTGKSLLMSVLANKVVTELGIPVILVKEGYAGEAFNSFIEDIGEACILFDEFGKMYAKSDGEDDKASQNSLLSLMDGVDKTKRFIIMTENEEHDISSFMINRPSRVYYHFRYSKLEEDSVTEYCDDNGLAEEVKQEILDLRARSRIFSFDMLQTIVEEYLRFNEDINTIIEDLNIDIVEEMLDYIDVIRVVDKKTEEDLTIYGSSLVVKPAPGHLWAEISVEDREDKTDWEDITFNVHQLKYEKENKLVYETEDHIIVAKPSVTKTYNYDAY